MGWWRGAVSGEGERLKKKHKQRFDVTCRVVSLCIQTVHRQRMPGPCHAHRVSGERQQALALLLTVGPGHCLSILTAYWQGAQNAHHVWALRQKCWQERKRVCHMWAMNAPQWNGPTVFQSLKYHIRSKKWKYSKNGEEQKFPSACKWGEKERNSGTTLNNVFNKIDLCLLLNLMCLIL